MNKTMIIGNLTSDPVLREVNTATGPMKVCNFNVAVNERRNGTDRVTYFAVSAWRNQADVCKQYLAKGRKVYVAGPISVTIYTDASNQPRASLNIAANEIEFLGGGERPANAAPGATQNAATPMPNYDAPVPGAAPNYAAPANNYAAPAPTAGFEAVTTDELPF